MNYYLAPLEGITGYVYRKAYYDFFHNVDKYYIPFVEPHIKRDFNHKELSELTPDHNQGFHVVPQILTNRAEDFLRTADSLMKFGYDEINLNLGCPSGTVVSKGKGSGFLEFTDRLDQFLENIFDHCPCRISIKTRIGRYEAEEFPHLMEIYRRYPLHELIVHPRTREDYYNGTPRLDSFAYALSSSKVPVCYNGDIYTPEDLKLLQDRFPTLSTVMIGRGILRDPQLIDRITKGCDTDWDLIRRFHDRIYQDYQETLSGERPLLFKMKELWCYELTLFGAGEKLTKKLKKVQKRSEYDAVVDELFRSVL